MPLTVTVCGVVRGFVVTAFGVAEDYVGAVDIGGWRPSPRPSSGTGVVSHFVLACPVPGQRAVITRSNCEPVNSSVPISPRRS